jgi:hypothetical protein
MQFESQQELSEDTKACLRQLRELTRRAEQGKLHGLCFTAANNDRTYDAEVVGSYESYPTDAIGQVEVLKLKLTRSAMGIT